MRAMVLIAAPVAFALISTTLRGDLIPHTGDFTLRREVMGSPPEPLVVGQLTGTATVNTLPTPSPETVTYEYPGGLTLAAAPAPVQFFIALNPISGTGQHVPIAPFDWENTLTFLASATHGSDVYSSIVDGSFRSRTPGHAFGQTASWTLLGDVRLFLNGDPNAAESLVLEAGSTLVTIPAPGGALVGLVAVVSVARRRR